jgi:hypothetical protein
LFNALYTIVLLAKCRANVMLRLWIAVVEKSPGSNRTRFGALA